MKFLFGLILGEIIGAVAMCFFQINRHEDHFEDDYIGDIQYNEDEDDRYEYDELEKQDYEDE